MTYSVFSQEFSRFPDNTPPLDVCCIIVFPDMPPLAAAWLLIRLNGLFSILVFTDCRPSIISSLCASSSSLLDNSDLFLTSPRIFWATSGTFSFCLHNKRLLICKVAVITGSFHYEIKREEKENFAYQIKKRGNAIAIICSTRHEHNINLRKKFQTVERFYRLISV